jgi:hypothetical protein
VNQPSEHKILLALLERRGKRPRSAAGRHALKLVVWLAIAASTFGLVVKFGEPDFAIIVTAIVGLATGTLVGVISVAAAARGQWPIIERYIDFEAIEARLRELET